MSECGLAERTAGLEESWGVAGVSKKLFPLDKDSQLRRNGSASKQAVC